MILRDTTQTIAEAIIKSNPFAKCPMINGGGCFIYGGTKKDRLTKLIYGYGRFIYEGGQKMSASENEFTRRPS